MYKTKDISLKMTRAKGDRRWCLSFLVDALLSVLLRPARVSSTDESFSQRKKQNLPEESCSPKPGHYCFHLICPFFTNLVSHKVSFFSLPGNLKWFSTPCAASLKRQEEHTMCSILSFHLSLGSAIGSVLASPQCSDNSKSPHWPEERWLLAALPEGSFASRSVRHRSAD